MEIDELLQRVGENLSWNRAFGPPHEHNGSLVIPVSLVFGGGGIGTQSAQQQGEGVGFGGIIHPLGVYVIREDRVKFVPTVDATALLLGSLLLVGRLLLRRRRKR